MHHAPLTRRSDVIGPGYYALLGVPQDADTRTIQAAYKGQLDRAKAGEVSYDEPTTEERRLKEKRIGDVRSRCKPP